MDEHGSASGNLQHVGTGCVVPGLSCLITAAEIGPALVQLWAVAASVPRTPTLEAYGTLRVGIRAVLSPVARLTTHETSITSWPWTMSFPRSSDSVAAHLTAARASANAGPGVHGKW